jgi:hypothetical protein
VKALSTPAASQFFGATAETSSNECTEGMGSPFI